MPWETQTSLTSFFHPLETLKDTLEDAGRKINVQIKKSKENKMKGVTQGRHL